MSEDPFYFFDPQKLSFEKEKRTVKSIVKRLLWLFATALSFAILVLWIAFYVFDSPKEKMLQRENNELKQALRSTNKKMEVMELVLSDIQERDDDIYRAIFEADPIPIEQRYPNIYSTDQYSDLTQNEAKALMEEVGKKVEQLMIHLAVQSRSLDTISDMAMKQAEMLAAIPAIRPLRNMYRISSGFGRRYHPILKTLRPHTGIDIAAPKGTPIYATADGVVAKETGGSGYGITVVLNHGYSYKTLYAHMSKKVVKPGQKIKRGQIIGYVGNTGLSFGSHLHYEVIKGGQYVDPVYYFSSDVTPEEYEEILRSSKEVNQALS